MGRLFVVSGPSGAGKSTLTKKIVKDENIIELTISATTRAPREGEVDKKDYYFLSKEEFEKKIEEDEFVEYANVHGNYYGTLKSEVSRKIEAGKNVLLEIDVQGGEQIKEKFEDALLIFVTTPSEEELEKRLRNRATDKEEVIQLRLKNSLKELEYIDKYDRVLVNDDFELAYDELKAIIIEEGGN